LRQPNRYIPSGTDIGFAAVAFPLGQRQVDLELERRVYFLRSELDHLSAMHGEGARANLGLGSTGPVVVDLLEVRADLAGSQIFDLVKFTKPLEEPDVSQLHRGGKSIAGWTFI